jgi:hypothetical protein
MDVSDFVDLALSKIPSSFGKLTFLAGLRDDSTGRYTDPLAALAYGKVLDAVLERRHREIFFAWLVLDLATQSTQVAQHLAVDDKDQNTLIEQWIQERLYEKLIPSAAGEVERKLFVSDLMTILLLLQGQLNSSEESDW